jgi:ribosomal protein S18 acetylase RimI-like enzyme
MTAPDPVTIRRARESDIPYIAAMHIPPASQAALREHVLRGGPWFNFYLDKIRVFYRLEQEGLLVAEDRNGLVGFCMASRDVGRFKTRAMTSGMAMSMVLNALCLRYGMSASFLQKALMLLVALVTRRTTRIVKEAKGSSLSYTMHKAMIYAWLVVVEKRGSGVGRSLLEAACCYLRAGGAREVGVMTRQDNMAALQTYDYLGFRRVATRIESVGKVFYMVKDFAECAEKASSAHT